MRFAGIYSVLAASQLSAQAAPPVLLGRVVIVAEISMLMKDPLGPDDPNDPQRLGSGLDYAHADNRQFAQNMLEWLLRTH
jgi:hypothetical protein